MAARGTAFPAIHRADNIDAIFAVALDHAE
jgi:hypothetical protein